LPFARQILGALGINKVGGLGVAPPCRNPIVPVCTARPFGTHGAEVFVSSRSLSGIRKHKLDLPLSSAKIESGKPALRHLLPLYARKAVVCSPCMAFPS